LYAAAAAAAMKKLCAAAIRIFRNLGALYRKDAKDKQNQG
jgi:hypothetical protein